MPFQLSSARSAAQAADLIAEMQASGMLAQDPDAIAIDGELTPDDLLLLDNFGNLDLPTFDSIDNKTTHGEQTTQNEDMKFLDFLNGKFVIA